MTSISPFTTAGVQSVGLTEDHVMSVVLMRRARSAVFGENLFSDPAWDILLTTVRGHASRRDMSLLDLAKATQTPVSTTARWMGLLKGGVVLITET